MMPPAPPTPPPEADRIEDVGLHPSRWRLVTATS